MISFERVWKTTEVRNSILFVLAMVVLFRLTTHIPISGIDADALSKIFQGNQFFGLLDIFSGGALKSFSVMALGVGPYITASIIFQLLGMIVPKFEEMQKEERGRQKINQWSRLLTVPLSVLQAYSILLLLEQQKAQILQNMSPFAIFLAILSMTAGTMFLMWIGELISERKIGNGISLVIFAGIVAGLPTFLSQALSVYDRSQMITTIVFFAVVLVTVACIVIMNEAQRNVPIQYARQVRGARLSGAVSSHMPIKLNLGGVIPIIFAISIILVPGVFAQFFINARTEFVREAAVWISQLMQNQLFYGVLYFALVFAFTYFYAAVIFHPDTVAENLQKQGGFIPGIRPGKPTSEYLGWVTNRVLLAGAIFLAVVAVLPLVVQQMTGNANIVIGGTSILIVVSVVIETVKQIEAQLTMRQYDM